MSTLGSKTGLVVKNAHFSGLKARLVIENRSAIAGTARLVLRENRFDRARIECHASLLG
jgi:hypothetical protein